MAFRIDIQVVRGEIDNRIRGKVRGRIWLVGRTEPLLLELEGNPWRDLAGCRLEFVNPKPQVIPNMPEMASDQTGTVGDITASRKVRVPEVPIAEFYEKCKQGQRPPEHWANSLYLEWFSRTNGRVVIESADFTLTPSLPEWQMTEAEERGQKEANGKAMTGFLARLTDAIEQSRNESREAAETGGDTHEMDEFGWEKTLRASDTVGEKYAELLDKYGTDPENEAFINRAMGWSGGDAELVEDANAEAWKDADDTEADGEQAAREELEAEMDEDDGFAREQHPLVQRTHDAAIKLWHWCKDHGLLEHEGTIDADIDEMTFKGQMLGAKLAGALSCIDHRLPMMNGFVVAALKRALPILDAAQAATGRVGAKTPPPVPVEMLAAYRDELFAIREEMLRIMEEFRRRG